jgi:hypothetical protein
MKREKGLYVLTLSSVEHTNALGCAVVENSLAEPHSTGRSNRLGGSNRLGQEARRKPRFLLREGPHREQCA